MEGHPSEVDPQVAALYGRFESLVQACGPVTVSPEKTQIHFKLRSTFAGVTLTKQGFRVGILLERKLDDPRIRQIETVSPRSHAHAFLV